MSEPGRAWGMGMEHGAWSVGRGAGLVRGLTPQLRLVWVCALQAVEQRAKMALYRAGLGPRLGAL